MGGVVYLDSLQFQCIRLRAAATLSAGEERKSVGCKLQRDVFIKGRAGNDANNAVMSKAAIDEEKSPFKKINSKRETQFVR